MNVHELQQDIERLGALESPPREAGRAAVETLLAALESGDVRAAQPSSAGGWTVNEWVKRGILLAFRLGTNRASAAEPALHFRDRDTLPTWNPNTSARDVRVVPGGSSVRRGAYLAEGVVIMPPAYVNIGAWVGEDSMIDSHALVGSCAQVGARVHLSAAAQVGGVLEPVGALPVIVEDDVFVGGGCGIYEGTRVCHGAVLAPGTILTRAVPLHDLVREVVHRADARQPLCVPANAVVVPGARPAGGPYAGRLGLQLQTPVIIKYRDASTEAAVALEEALR